MDYPNGPTITAARVARVKALVDAGVDELDATVNVGYLLSGRSKNSLLTWPPSSLRRNRSVSRSCSNCRFSTRGNARPLQRRDRAGAFVSIASSGLGRDRRPGRSGTSTAVPASVGVKASGGLKTVEQVRALLAAGADLIGTSAGIHIVTGSRLRSTGSLYSY